MRARRLWLALPLSSLLVLVHCVGDEPTGTPPTSTPDAAGVSNPDATTTRPDADSGATPGPDAAPDAAATSTFCDGVDAAFCADFDRGTIESAGFTMRDGVGSGTFALQNGTFVSPPSSALLAVSDAGGKAVLRHTIPMDDANRTLHFEVDVRLPTYVQTGGFNSGVQHLRFNANGAASMVTVTSGANGLGIQPTGFGQPTSIAHTATTEWMHLVFDITFGANATGAIHVTVDGLEGANLPGVATMQDVAPVTSGEVLLGPNPFNNANIAVSVDNFVMRARP